MPDDMPDRTAGGCRRNDSNACTFHFNDSCTDGIRCPVTMVQDFASFDPFAEQITQELYNTYDILPFVVVAQWNRKKIDFNRGVVEATFHHPKAIKAYNGYHTYLKRAIKRIQKNFGGQGLLLDVHQHAQGKYVERRQARFDERLRTLSFSYTMVGIRLSAAQLNADNLSGTSIESLIDLSCPEDRSECIRGTKSFGTFLESNGLGVSYPSLDNPKPMNNTFYRGGYITNHYSSDINVIQTELSYVVRNELGLQFYAENYAQALISFMQANDLLQVNGDI